MSSNLISCVRFSPPDFDANRRRFAVSFHRRCAMGATFVSFSTRSEREGRRLAHKQIETEPIFRRQSLTSVTIQKPSLASPVWSPSSMEARDSVCAVCIESSLSRKHRTDAESTMPQKKKCDTPQSACEPVCSMFVLRARVCARRSQCAVCVCVYIIKINKIFDVFIQELKHVSLVGFPSHFTHQKRLDERTRRRRGQRRKGRCCHKRQQRSGKMCIQHTQTSQEQRQRQHQCLCRCSPTTRTVNNTRSDTSHTQHVQRRVSQRFDERIWKIRQKEKEKKK